MRQLKKAEPLAMFELVFPSDLNAHGSMFGGRVVALMDKCAGMCSGRWAGNTVVTACIDAIQFGTPILQGQMVEFVAKVAYVGNTSCVVQVQVFAQAIGQSKKSYCCQGFFTMVAVNSEGKPVGLPMIPIENDADQQLWDEAREIKEAMLARRMQAARAKNV